MTRKTMVDTRSTIKSKEADKKQSKRRAEDSSDSEESGEEIWETESDSEEERDLDEETLVTATVRVKRKNWNLMMTNHMFLLKK